MWRRIHNDIGKKKTECAYVMFFLSNFIHNTQKRIYGKLNVVQFNPNSITLPKKDVSNVFIV